jgi:tetratricopeptide (TPR) repeat protein
MRRHWWVVVLTAGILAWSGSLNNAFQYDDFHSIYDNFNVRLTNLDASSRSAVANYFEDPSTFSVDADKGMYRPLLVTTYALNYLSGVWLGVGGYDVVGYHVVNLTLHLGCALLAGWLAMLLGGSQRAGLLAGLLLVLHPVAAEPVNYISSRSESLSVLFYLLAVCWFLRAESGREIFRWAAWVAMAAGLLSKSTTITLPAALLLLDYFVLSGRDLRRVGTRLVRCHLPGWIVAGLYLAIVSANGWLGRSLAQQVRGSWEQALTQLKASVYYVHLLLVPARLSVEPQFVEQSAFAVETAMSLLLLLSAAVCMMWLARSGRWRALFLLSWAALHLLPTMIVPLNVLVNERRAYGPLAILCVGAGLLLAGLRLHPMRRFVYRRALLMVACVVFGILSFGRSRVWANDFSLWKDAVQKAPRMARTHLYLGNAHKDAAQHTQDASKATGHWQAATASYARAAEEARTLDLQLRALNNRGGVHMALFGKAVTETAARKDLRIAEEMFLAAVKSNPGYADALVNLGSVSTHWARMATSVPERDSLRQQSIERYKQALKVRPNHYQALGNLGVVFQDLGDFDNAEKLYRHALRLTPRDWLSMKNLATVLFHLAQRDQADQQIERARTRLLEGRTLVRQALGLNQAVANGQQVLRAIETQIQALSQAR